MEKERYMLILNDEYIYRFKWFSQAIRYARIHYNGDSDHYIVVDTVSDAVIASWPN